MATVINATELRRAFITLGWDNLSLAETQEWLKETGISTAGVLSFCNQLIAHPDGLDEAQFTAPPSQEELPFVVQWFQGKGVVF